MITKNRLITLVFAKRDAKSCVLCANRVAFCVTNCAANAIQFAVQFVCKSLYKLRSKRGGFLTGFCI